MVSTLLNLARQAIYGLCNRRAIPFYKRNIRLYFKRSELLAWIEEGRKKTQVEFDEVVANYISKTRLGNSIESSVSFAIARPGPISQLGRPKGKPARMTQNFEFALFV